MERVNWNGCNGTGTAEKVEKGRLAGIGTLNGTGWQEWFLVGKFPSFSHVYLLKVTVDAAGVFMG